MYRLLYLLPKNLLSLVIGKLAHIPLPAPLSTWLVDLFARSYKIDLSEAAESKFNCIGSLFIRDLKTEVRPIGAEPVAPVDGTLRNAAAIKNGEIEQIKGKNYSLKKFLGNEDLANKFENGHYFNFYLAPPDYHHIHSPVSGEITEYTHIPGKLWPVNDWSIANIDELFAVNERVVVPIKTAKGLVVVVMVGATNVGSIGLSLDPTFRSNKLRLCRGKAKTIWLPTVSIKAGDRLGTFHLGSSVVLLFERSYGINILSRTHKVRYGESLLAASSS